MLPKLRDHLRDAGIRDTEIELTVLVGSNPLPPVVAVLALLPCKVHVVYTAQVKIRADRLIDFLKKKELKIGEQLPLSSENDPASLRVQFEAFFQAHPGGLHYSGGTKAMAVHAHAAWQKVRKTEKNYEPWMGNWLGSDGKLYFDGAVGFWSLLDEPKLTFGEIWNLHTGTRPACKNEHREPEKLAIARRIAQLNQQKLEEYRKSLPRIYASTVPVVALCEKPAVFLKVEAINLARYENFKEGNPAINALLEPTGSLHSLLFEETPGTYDDVVTRLDGKVGKMTAKRRCDAAKWLYGEWLEVWLADVLASITESDSSEVGLFDEVVQDIKVEDNPNALQIDVAAVRGNRVFVFSCTVDESKPLVKSKLFEARMRAEQLGGDLARFAVFSFYKKGAEAILEEVAAEGFAGYGDARSFAWEHFTDTEKLNTDLRQWVLT